MDFKISGKMSDDEERTSTLQLDMSPIKKEKMLKEKKIALRQKLRQGLPVLSVQEIRRYRLPYHEALLIDLSETGFPNTSEFIKQLIELQERMRKKFGPGTVIWARPLLQKSKENLDLLTKCLTIAEAAHNAKDFSKEWDEILQLAAYFAFGPDDWWWLGEQLLWQCVSLEYPGDFKKQEAIAYFIIGKYLVENGKKMETGRYYLDLAREMSKGKSWSANKILNKKCDIVFIEACKLLYVTLIEEASILIKNDPTRALDICNLARKRAAEACDHEHEYQALILRGKAELQLNQSAKAIATMTKALNRTVRQKNIKGICETKIALALAYLQHGKPDDCFECLKDLKVLADEHDLSFYLGQAYRFMGEYHLNQKEPYEATPLLMLAFYIFHENQDLRRREKVRTWAAISAGEELFSAYIRLIEKCDNTAAGRENIQKLIRWIDEREFFWTQHSKFSFSYNSLQQSVFEEDLTIDN